MTRVNGAERATGFDGSSGFITTPLVDGVAFTTQAERDVQSDLALRLGPGHPALTTVAVPVRDGGFLLGRPAGGRATVVETVHTGRELAAALSALPLYGQNLRLWLGWPGGESDQRRLGENLLELAATSGATVWAPALGSVPVPLGGCRDLAAHSLRTEGGRWQAFRPPDLPADSWFSSDVDGRLMPADGPVVVRAGGVAVVSVPLPRQPALIQRYDAVWATDGLMLVDLTLLADGRLAARYRDDSVLAIGPRELRRILREAGWVDEDLGLLTAVASAQVEVLQEHLSILASHLEVDIYVRAPDGSLAIQDGAVRAYDADRRPAEWLRVTAPGGTGPARWRGQDGWLVAARPSAGPSAPIPMPVPPPIPVAIPVPSPAPLPDPPSPAPVIPPPTAPPPTAPPPTAPPPTAPPPPTPARSTVPPPPTPVTAPTAPPARPRMVRPTMMTAPARARPHGIAWLPAHLPVNAEPLRLFVRSALSPDQVAAEGVPSPEVFLLGRADGEPPAPGVHVLDLMVDAGCAIDAAAVSAHAPAALRPLLRAADAFLLPGGWLDRVRLPNGDPLVLRCTGARHGVDGLPNTVAPWPRSRIPARSYAILRDPDADFVELRRHRPPVTPGVRLLHVRIGRAAAIDVAVSAARVLPLTLVRSRLAELRAAGVDVVLPRGAYDRARVTRVFEAHHGSWRVAARGVDVPLARLMAGAPR